MSSKKNNIHIQVADGASDKERIEMATGIGKVAPQSAIYAQHPEVHTAVDNVVALGALLKTQGDTATGFKAQLAATMKQIAQTRIKFGLAVGALRGNAENVVTTVEEAGSLGLKAQVGASAPAPLAVPTGIGISLGKTHGQFRVVAEGTGRHFGAQLSADPVTAASWVELPGTGRRRLVTGRASGQLVWVRFRALRGQTASEWSQPVSLTVP